MSYVKSASQLLAEMQQIWKRADVTGRDLTPAERTEVEDLMIAIKGQKRIEDIGRELGAPGFTANGFNAYPHTSAGGPGDMFVKSEGWKSIADPSSRGQTWSTGPVEVGYMTKAGTAFEGGQGAGWTLTPEVVPGVVDRLFEPLSVADLFKSGQTTASSVRYIVEGTATPGAAGVAEGGLKPASDLAYSVVDEPVKKVATTLVTSDEMLDDAVQIQTYLNSRLSLFVAMEEERQLLRGSGTNELVGIFNRSGINQYTRAAGDDNATALAKVLANTAGSAFLVPDAVVMHPINWLSTRLLRDGTGGTTGQFFGGGPFTGAYGNGGAADAGLFGSSLWGTRVVLEYAGRSGNGACRCVRPGGADLPPRRTDRRGHQLASGFLPEEPGDAARGVQAGTRVLPAVRLHRSEGARVDQRLRRSPPWRRRALVLSTQPGRRAPIHPAAPANLGAGKEQTWTSHSQKST